MERRGDLCPALRAFYDQGVTDPSGGLPGRTVPLRQRRFDWVLLAFFAVNLCFITYFIDIEQLTVPNAFHFQYPAWPPHAIVDLVHSYGRRYDPLLLARLGCSGR